FHSRLPPPGRPLPSVSGLRDAGRPGAPLAALPVPPAAQLQPWGPGGRRHGISPQLQLRIHTSTERPNG
ncbi:hypothetical protein NQZ68_005862, partial [Dissostichus eleginoides]